MKQVDLIEQRIIAEKAHHYTSDFVKGRKYYEINHWSVMFKNIHPKLSDPHSPTRTLCVKTLNIALKWHLDNKLNTQQRNEIKKALESVNSYA